MEVRFDAETTGNWARRVLATFRRRQRLHALQAMTEQLTPQLLTDIGLSGSGELLEEVGAAVPERRRP